MTSHRTSDELDALLDHIRDAPTDGGELSLIVARPGANERRSVAEAQLSTDVGLVGDNWLDRGARSTDDGSADPLRQLTIMTTRAVDAVAGDTDRWALAGDQLYIDIDLSHGNLPAGTKLAIGDAVVEITEPPHTGCAKFVERFGKDAMRWVNNEVGRELRLRGANARVLTEGTVRIGDRATKLDN